MLGSDVILWNFAIGIASLVIGLSAPQTTKPTFHRAVAGGHCWSSALRAPPNLRRTTNTFPILQFPTASNGIAVGAPFWSRPDMQVMLLTMRACLTAQPVLTPRAICLPASNNGMDKGWRFRRHSCGHCLFHLSSVEWNP